MRTELPAPAPHESAARAELLDRLQYFQLAPAAVLDLGEGGGLAARELKRRYRRALIIAMGPCFQRRRFFHRFARVHAAARSLPLRTASLDLVFSNLLLRTPEEVPTVLAEIQRVLRPGGLLMLSAGGTATPALDVQDLGDALAHSGFAQPVLDVDRYGTREIIFAAAWAGHSPGAALIDGEARVPVAAIGHRGRAEHGG